MKLKQLILLILIGLLLSLYFYFDLDRYFTLEYFKAQQEQINTYYTSHRISSILIFFFIYISVTGLSLPGAALLSLIAGALFGLAEGTVIVSFASTIGATIAFLMARFLFRDLAQEKFHKQLKAINSGIEKEGDFYLFTLRLIPLFPFFIINIVMALTPIRTLNFFIVSQLGMLPATIVYVNAGTQLAGIESLNDIMSPNLLLSFLLLGIFPLIAKKIIETVRRKKIYKTYSKPKRFDFNLTVIGAGSAGLVCAYIAAAIKAKVALIEKHKMGGDCLNTGCVPSKALIRSAKMLKQIQNASLYGLQDAQVNFNFSEVMHRVHSIINTIEPHDSVERYTQLGVDCFQGKAKITSPYEIGINGKIIRTKNIIIATGAIPTIPTIPGIENTDYITSDTLWSLTQQPKRLLILGGGPIGCELAQSFARLGSQVSQVEMLPRLLFREDPDVSELIKTQLQKEGVKLYLNHRAKRLLPNKLICENLHNENDIEIEFDQILFAIGRKPVTEGFGLEELGIPLNRNGTIQVNEYMQTVFPNIYACGDIAGPYQFTHTASHQAWYCTVNALFNPLKKFRVDYSIIPWATFTDPEVARVGLNETEATAKNIPFTVTIYNIEDLDRAITDSTNKGFIKVLTQPNKDKILGVTIAGEQAGDLIAEYVLAMKHNIGLNKILSTIHIYPTLAEANKYVAGNWKRQHAPKNLLGWLQRFHHWRLK